MVICISDKQQKKTIAPLHNGDDFLVERTIIPVRWRNNSSRKLTWDEQKKNRALNLLFMATSPLGIKPVLDFEAEEGQILEATKRIPLSLKVEESGCLKELGYLVQTYEKGHFDIFHLVGHATFKNEKHCFITETELGEPEYSSANDIVKKLSPQKTPKIIFLSGCRTGYHWDEGRLSSMAEVLLKKGATAVLSWGDNVPDLDATEAAAILYSSLSAGDTLPEAIAKTYQELIEKKRKWHLLRLYVAKKLPGALVTSYNTEGRKLAPIPSVTTEFLDSEGEVRVASRESFISRRRQLQNCLRELKKLPPEGKIGVLIHSMGGLGKSTIASRLLDRLPEHTKIVWWRQIDEFKLVAQIKGEIENSEKRAALINNNEKLKYRLKSLFKNSNQKFLLVFDDFEWNLEPRDEGYILKPDVAQVLSDVVWAVKNQESITEHLIIITCRYDFKSDLLKNFYKQPLEGLRKADLQKKLKQLPNFEFDENDNKKKLIVERALKLADGNPRLLEWLNDDVLSKENADSELSELEASSEGWKEKVIWVTEDAPKLKIDSSIEKIVSRCLVFEIPVPKEALEAVSDSKEQLNQAIKLGLIEVSPEPREEDRVYRVSRILPHIITHIRLPEAPEVYSLSRKAHDKLHELWGNEENRSEEKWREIFRLLFADKNNPERFRQGFSKMLAVQYNYKADGAFEAELRRSKDELPKEKRTSQLENYLSQGDWRKADEETAWLFYVVMVQQDFKDWTELWKNFPSKILNEIDQLWVNHSKGKFGFSIQKRIWEGVGGNPNPDYEMEKKFGKQVEWYNIEKKSWKEYNSLPFSMESQDGNLPALSYTRETDRNVMTNVSSLASRLNL